LVALAEILESQKVTVDFGCGWLKHPDSIGVDVCHYNNDVVASAMQSPFREGSVDFVVAKQFLEHVDTQCFIRECWRILKKNGKLLLETPNALYIFKILRALRLQESNPYPEHIQTFSSAELRNLLERNGFRCLDIQFRPHKVNGFIKNLIDRIASLVFPMMKRDIQAIAMKDGRAFCEYG
jgi:predicted SAM-dependent methyltransferase